LFPSDAIHLIPGQPECGQVRRAESKVSIGGSPPHGGCLSLRGICHRPRFARAIGDKLDDKLGEENKTYPEGDENLKGQRRLSISPPCERSDRGIACFRSRSTQSPHTVTPDVCRRPTCNSGQVKAGSYQWSARGLRRLKAQLLGHKTIKAHPRFCGW